MWQIWRPLLQIDHNHFFQDTDHPTIHEIWNVSLNRQKNQSSNQLANCYSEIYIHEDNFMNTVPVHYTSHTTYLSIIRKLIMDLGVYTSVWQFSRILMWYCSEYRQWISSKHSVLSSFTCCIGMKKSTDFEYIFRWVHKLAKNGC